MRVKIIRERVYELMGLAMRAGKLVSGTFKVEESIKIGKARLVIISEESSENTFKKFHSLCGRNGINLIQMGSSEALGKALGKPHRIIVAIEDHSFKKMIVDSIPESKTNMGVIH